MQQSLDTDYVGWVDTHCGGLSYEEIPTRSTITNFIEGKFSYIVVMDWAHTVIQRLFTVKIYLFKRVADDYVRQLQTCIHGELTSVILEQPRKSRV